MGLVTAAIVVGAVTAGVQANEANKSRRAAQAGATDKNAMVAALREQMPEISDLELELLLPELVGEYTPEAGNALDLGPSSMEGVSADEQLKMEQFKALAGIGEVAEGGMTEGDMAASRQIQREVNQNNQARLDSILMDRAQRGVLGSGEELAAMMNSNQQAADAQANASDNLIRQAQQRSLQALTQQGNMAGNMRTQDVGEQTNVAKARDAINQFNVQNSQNVNNQNVANRNTAQQQNLQNRQSVSNARIGLQNKQQEHNKNLIVDNFNRNANLSGVSMGIRDSVTAAEQAQAAQNAAAAGQVGQGVLTAFGTPTTTKKT